MKSVLKALENKIAKTEVKMKTMLDIAKVLDTIPTNWGFNIHDGYFFTFDEGGQKIAHKLAKKFHCIFKRHFDASTGHFDYVGEVEGVEIRIWDAKPIQCEIRLVKEERRTVLHREYEAICR